MSQILVTAATGNVGTPLVHALKQKDLNFTAGTRDAEGAQDQLGESVDTVFLDYEEPDSFGPALEGHQQLFLCGPSATPNAAELIMPMVEEAQKQDIEHIVFIASHPSVANAIEESGIDYTFINANFFMENFEMYQTKDIRERQQLFLPCGEGTVSFIHCRDIGEAAAELLANPSDYKQQTISLTGPEAVDLFEAADIFSEVLGTNITYKNPDDETYRSEMERRDYSDTYIDAMIAVFGKIKDGSRSDVSPMVEQILDRPPLSLKDYLEENEEQFQVT
ncbi:NmrA family NAD(P)-binding protein [Halalkalibaculum sp. DA3122]|uniref:NmrA family NAD(P)-binding protein n=1 Tax=unclassified Halalkalibaculum TaxID=2964617 RepID=UPI003754EDFE